MRLTGILAEIVMIIWCSELTEILENAGVKNDMIPRFVDDITLVPTIVPPGWKIRGGRLEFFEDSVIDDDRIPGDIRTMEVIKEIADNISDNLQVTYDFPSNTAFYVTEFRDFILN